MNEKKNQETGRTMSAGQAAGYLLTVATRLCAGVDTLQVTSAPDGSMTIHRPGGSVTITFSEEGGQL